jgi:tetratricopeptide (TPR) repeat protein
MSAAYTEEKLGDLYFKWKRFEDSERYYKAAGTIYRSASDDWTTSVLLSLGKLYMAWGALCVDKDAIEKYVRARKALEYLFSRGDSTSEVAALLAESLIKLGEHEPAARLRDYAAQLKEREDAEHSAYLEDSEPELRREPDWAELASRDFHRELNSS